MAKREISAHLLTDRKLIVFVTLVVGFSLLGPFGTYADLELWPRVVFWSLIVAGIGAAMHLAVILMLRGDTFAVLPRPLRIVIGTSIAAIPGAAIVIFLSGYFYEGPLRADAFPWLWAQIAAIGAPAGLFEYRLPRAETEARPDTGTGTAPVEIRPDTAAQPEPRLHARLPDGEGRDIVSLTVKDHYVEVTTTAGRHLLLMRLSDAIAELEGLPGLQLHRSHWAAAAHVVGLTRRNRKPVAVLSDGRELPVSKTHLEAVRALAGPETAAT